MATSGGGSDVVDADGLTFGKKICFEQDAAAAGGSRRGSTAVGGRKRKGVARPASASAASATQPPRCQVDGCGVDLSAGKQFYCRHQVCHMHSKAPSVVMDGIEQRFCQQCNRFHQLPEFDQGKRSCRRRLVGHAERGRKPPPDPFASRYGHLAASEMAGVLAGQPAMPTTGLRIQTLGSPPCAEQIGLEVQIFSSSLGAMVPLLAKLRSLLLSPEDQLPEPLKLHKDNLELLKQDLEAINTFLVNLSSVDPNMMVKHWMNDVRDLSYDIEDYIDKMMHPCLISREESRSDSDVDELSALMKQAKDAHERHNRYDLGRWASNPRFVVDGGGQRWVPTDLVGIDDSKAELIKRLNIDAKKRLVVAVQGPPGVGKTTLVKQVYCEMEGQFECQAFVRASKMPDIRRLLGSIISQIKRHHHGPPHAHGLPVQELIDSLTKHLQQKRYLIVIDGLWETTSWDIVNSAFPDDDHCSRILITTDVEEVALECCDYESDAIFKMEPLDGNHSTELFLNRVLGFKHECSKQLKESSEAITRACGGLPLAIISIASILAIQPDNLELWRRVKEALFSRSRYNLASEVMLREIVGLSYNSLPCRLKTCLLYLSMYPEGYTFLKAGLVKQWSAEGFIVPVEEKNCDEVAECYFDELTSRGLIQPNHTNISDGVTLYTVHSTVFEFIRSMSIEENFSTVIDYSNTISELSVKVRRLSLRFSSAKYATKPETIKLSPVRSLIFFGLVDCLPSIMEFEVLRVLILDVWGDKEELDLSGIDRLFQLRYVRITSNIIVKLPARMIGLPYLQTMEIYARVTSIPSDISHLPRLLHLHVQDMIPNKHSAIGVTSELSEMAVNYVPKKEEMAVDYGGLSTCNPFQMEDGSGAVVPSNSSDVTDRSDKPLDQKTMRQLAQNRETARKSRLRKKKYVQQLENSKLKLAQLEQELQKARQQGIIISSSGDQTHAMSGNGALTFNIEYARWLEDQNKQISELRTAVNAHAIDSDLRLIVDGIMAHYDEIFKVKGVAAKADVFHILSGMWKTPAERCFLWLGGFRPSELLKLLANHLEPLTEQQMHGLFNLQQSSRQAEDALSQGVEAVQQSLAETLVGSLGPSGSSGNVANYMGQMAMAMGKLGMLENFVRQADNLRQQTLHQKQRILTIRQASLALLAINDYFSRLRALSSLWLAAPRE